MMRFMRRPISIARITLWADVEEEVAMKEITVALLLEYLAQIASVLRRIDYDLSIYLEEHEETEINLPYDLIDIFELREYLP